MSASDDNYDHRDGQRYAIGAVAKLTGLSTHTIRIWERRYEAVVAERSENGRRRYCPEDVEKLALLKRLTDAGIAISMLAGDDLAALRERAAEMGELGSGDLPARIAVAALGEELPARLRAAAGNLAPLDLVVGDHDKTRFLADLSRHQADVVVLEVPVIEERTTDELGALVATAGAAGAVLVYNFTTSRHADRARREGFVTLRAPVDIDDLRSATVRALRDRRAPRNRLETTPADSNEAQWRFDDEIPRRRFDRRQLSRLAAASTTIDCECPQHLAHLVSDLSAFEIYSAGCANRDDEDAALHHFLHRATAQARSLIEGALERVADAEGLEY